MWVLALSKHHPQATKLHIPLLIFRSQLMVFEFVGKFFDFIVCSPPREPWPESVLDQDELEPELERPNDHSLSEPTVKSVDNLNLKAMPMDNAPLQAPEGI